MPRGSRLGCRAQTGPLDASPQQPPPNPLCRMIIERGTARPSPCTLLLTLLRRCQTTSENRPIWRLTEGYVRYRTYPNQARSYKTHRGRLHQTAPPRNSQSRARRAVRAVPAPLLPLSTAVPSCAGRHLSVRNETQRYGRRTHGTLRLRLPWMPYDRCSSVC